MKIKYRPLYTKFIQAWNILKKNTDMMLVVTICCVFLAGIITIDGIERLGLEEANRSLLPLFELYGAGSVIAYDTLAVFSIIIFFYVTQKWNDDVHTLVMMFLFASSIMNVMNDVGWVYDIEQLKVLGRVVQVCQTCLN